MFVAMYNIIPEDSFVCRCSVVAVVLVHTEVHPLEHHASHLVAICHCRDLQSQGKGDWIDNLSHIPSIFLLFHPPQLLVFAQDALLMYEVENGPLSTKIEMITKLIQQL